MNDDGTLVAWLAAMDPAQLERCLVLRSDVLRGATPADLADLAERLVHPASVGSALLALPVSALVVLELAAALGSGASVASIAARLEPAAARREAAADHEATVAHLVQALQGTALAWPGPSGGVVVNPGVTALLTAPLGLGRRAASIVVEVSATELAKVTRRWGMDVPKRKAEQVEAVCAVLGDPDRVRSLVAAAPEPVARVIDGWVRDAAVRLALSADLGDPEEDEELPRHLRSQHAYGAYRLAAAWAREHGLAYGPVFEMTVEVPCEVLLALVDPAVRLPFAPDPPLVPTAPVAEVQVAQSAAAAVTGLVSAAMGVLEHLSRHPVALLRSGGVGARELARVAKVLGVDTAMVRVALECAVVVGLLEVADEALTTAEAFDGWRRGTPGRRAADLLLAWLDLGLAPTVDRYEDGKAVPALARDPFRGPDAAARRLVLERLPAEPGRGVVGVESLVEAVAWRLPLAVGRRGAPSVRAAWHEAELLGVAAHGRLGPVGQALLERDEAALVAVLERTLPAVERRVLVGSDHTVVVAGTPDVAVVDLLDAVAVRESRGTASTWRLTPASVRGALDEGYELDDLLGGLSELAGGALPQATAYLLRDVGRRHGHVQVAPAGSVVVGEDEALLAEVAAHRSLRRLGLRRVAPTVLVARAEPQAVLLALRAQGYLPVELDDDGGPVVQLRRVVRDGGGDAGPGARPPTVIPARGTTEPLAGLAEPLAGLAERLLAGRAAPAPELPALDLDILAMTSRLSRPEVRQLAHAIEHGLPVQIRYRASSGGITLRVVSDLRLDRGYLWGYCHLRQDDRYFLVSSILAVAAVVG